MALTAISGQPRRHQVFELRAMKQCLVVNAFHVVVRTDIRINSPSPIPRQEMHAQDVAVRVGVKEGFVSPERRVAVKA